jgi:hypothetical protein
MLDTSEVSRCFMLRLENREMPNDALHWTGSSRFSLLRYGCRWRLLPASELHRYCDTRLCVQMRTQE